MRNLSLAALAAVMFASFAHGHGEHKDKSGVTTVCHANRDGWIDPELGVKHCSTCSQSALYSARKFQEKEEAGLRRARNDNQRNYHERRLKIARLNVRRCEASSDDPDAVIVDPSANVKCDKARKRLDQYQRQHNPSSNEYAKKQLAKKCVDTSTQVGKYICDKAREQARKRQEGYERNVAYYRGQARNLCRQ